MRQGRKGPKPRWFQGERVRRLVRGRRGLDHLVKLSLLSAVLGILLSLLAGVSAFLSHPSSSVETSPSSSRTAPLTRRHLLDRDVGSAEREKLPSRAADRRHRLNAISPTPRPEPAATMRALEYRRCEGLILTERPVPSIGDEDVLLETLLSGVCGSDLRILDGTSRYRSRVVLGHEMVGRVSAVGSLVPDGKFEVGTTATVCPQYACRMCSQCRRGCPNFCTGGGGYGSTIGYYYDGCFAEFVKVHHSQVYVVEPMGLAMEQAVLSEPFNCLLNGWKKIDQVVGALESSRVLIQGGGIVGILWSALLCARGGARFLTLTEPKLGRRRIAKDYLSNTLGLDAQHGRALTPQDLDRQERFDLIIECCGRANAVEEGYRRLDHGGTLLVFGGPPRGSSIQIDPSEILFRELTIRGSVIGQDTFEDGQAALAELAKRGFLEPEALGMKFFSFEEHAVARAQLEEGRICKAVFVPRQKMELHLERGTT